MRREERVTVQGPVKEQQPDGMPHRGWVSRTVGGTPCGCDRRGQRNSDNRALHRGDVRGAAQVQSDWTLSGSAWGGGGGHTNDWAPRMRKRHQQEHRPQRPTERSDPTQHAKGRTGDCPQPDGMSHKGRAQLKSHRSQRWLATAARASHRTIGWLLHCSHERVLASEWCASSFTAARVDVGWWY